MRNYYSGDPYWLTLRWPGICAGCGASFPKGARAFRFKNKKLYGEPCGCGTAESERFDELARAEYAYGAGY
jgi:hypothetical protein